MHEDGTIDFVQNDGYVPPKAIAEAIDAFANEALYADGLSRRQETLFENLVAALHELVLHRVRKDYYTEETMPMRVHPTKLAVPERAAPVKK